MAEDIDVDDLLEMIPEEAWLIWLAIALYTIIRILTTPNNLPPGKTKNTIVEECELYHIETSCST